MAAHMKARVVKVKTRPDFSKQLISDIRWLLCGSQRWWDCPGQPTAWCVRSI